MERGVVLKKTLSFIMVAVMLIMLVSCTAETEEKPVAVVTVNGETVTQAEIDYFKGKFKTELINDYIEKYKIEFTEDFWQKEFDGKTPEEALYEKALEESIMVKIQFVLMREEGIYDDISFDGLYKKAEAFNAENAGKEGVVGIKSINMSQFYTYYFQNGVMELKNIYAEGKLKPTQEEIDEKINEIIDQYADDVDKQDYESVAKDQLETEKYDAYIAQLRKEAEIKDVK